MDLHLVQNICAEDGRATEAVLTMSVPYDSVCQGWKLWYECDSTLPDLFMSVLDIVF